MKAVENILRAYSIRNPTIGYCQGFNFIVGRLLKVVNEEVKIDANDLTIGSFLDVLPNNRDNDAIGLLF